MEMQPATPRNVDLMLTSRALRSQLGICEFTQNSNNERQACEFAYHGVHAAPQISVMLVTLRVVIEMELIPVKVQFGALANQFRKSLFAALAAIKIKRLEIAHLIERK